MELCREGHSLPRRDFRVLRAIECREDGWRMSSRKLHCHRCPLLWLQGHERHCHPCLRRGAEIGGERVYAYRHDDTAAPYLVRRIGVDLSSEEDVDKFLVEVEKLAEKSDYEVVLIIFDTLARSIGTLDENCSRSMTGVAETAEHIAAETGAHVMLIHHTGKDAERGGRGSSALRGAVFTELSLKPDGTAVVIAQEKQRTMAKALPVQFKTVPVVLGKDEDGEDRTTAHIVELAGKVEGARKPERGKESSGCDVAVLTALHIRGMMSKRSAQPFRPRDILSTLPSEVFGRIALDSQVKRVGRALEKLADRPQPLVKKVEQGWCLVPSDVPGPSERK